MQMTDAEEPFTERIDWIHDSCPWKDQIPWRIQQGQDGDKHCTHCMLPNSGKIDLTLKFAL